MKYKNHMITLVDAVKAFEQFNMSLWYKFSINGCTVKYLNKINVLYDKPTASIILNSEKQSFSSNIMHKTKIPTLTIITQHSIGSFR